MKGFAALLLWTAFAVQAATAQVVDLDKPGALDALKREKPAHYSKVLESIEHVQAVPYTENGQRNLRLDPEKPNPTGGDIQTSHPAKSRITIPVDETQYRITVVYTKHPATLTPAK